MYFREQLSKRTNRSCYDLEMHSKKTGVSMVASYQLDEPKTVTAYKLQVDRRALGTTFKADQKKARLGRRSLGVGGRGIGGYMLLSGAGLFCVTVIQVRASYYHTLEVLRTSLERNGRVKDGEGEGGDLGLARLFSCRVSWYCRCG